MKKKIISLLLTAGMTLGLVAGCGGSENAGNSDAATPAGTESGAVADNAATDEVYHMVWQITTYGFDDPDLQLVQDAVNEITVPEIGVEVEFKTIGIGEMATALSLAVSAGEQLDLVQTGLLITPAILQSQGLLQDITQYVEASPALMELANGIIDACKVDGKIYAYPGSNAPGAQTCFFYDADLAEQYNIEMPDSISSDADWEKIFEQVKASGMSQYGISLGDGTHAEYQYGVDMLGDGSSTGCYGVVLQGDTTNTIVNWYESEAYAAKCKLHHEWFEKGYCVPDSISNGYATHDSMSQGTILGFVTNSGTGASPAYWSKITGKNIKTIPINEVTISASNVVNLSWGVSSSCTNPEKVVKFLELLFTNTDLANIMNYGIEGTHYVTNEGSMIIDYPEGMDASTCGYGNFVGTYGDNLKTYQRRPMTDEIVSSFSQYAYPNANCSPYLAYAFDATSVSTQLANVNAVITQYAPALECGTVNPDEMIPVPYSRN